MRRTSLRNKTCHMFYTFFSTWIELSKIESYSVRQSVRVFRSELNCTRQWIFFPVGCNAYVTKVLNYEI